MFVYHNKLAKSFKFHLMGNKDFLFPNIADAIVFAHCILEHVIVSKS